MSLVLLGAGPEGCAFWWCVALLYLYLLLKMGV